ncbi:MAG: aminotransferase class I/II-fold pyridoxal phosphate-dependent enzyme [bacterium]|nr:aminotransferase class I/II-fold pyridoxal phosphate-dependent enzyme [bacterium]
MGRLQKLPPYLFAALDAAKRRARESGASVIDLGIGDPDRPTPAELIRVMTEAIADPACHRYPAQRGDADLKRAIAGWLRRRHGVEVDPSTQVLVLIGSKEGLAHLPVTCVQEGDNTLVPDIGYPVYAQATILAGGTPRTFRLRAANGFLPDLDEVAALMDDRTRLLFLNYPNNPTGATADQGFWRRAADLCARRGVTLVNDAAYLEMSLDGLPQPCLLGTADPARERVIELHSLSKMFNMTGWRVAFAVGHPELVEALGRVKDTMDSGVFTAIQRTAAYALGPDFDRLLAGVAEPYAARREKLVPRLAAAGYEVFPSRATFYVWCRIPGNEEAAAFCQRALSEIGVVVTPGTGFGSGGEGWFRLSLTASEVDLEEGARRLAGWT